MHSIPIAEPTGFVAGIVGGRLGRQVGKDLAEKAKIPKWVGALVGTIIGHYFCNVIVTAAINLGMVDPAGGVANVTVTSPATSVGHGIVEALLEAISDLT
jgi:hypothetical protein